ncbi:MAG: hypothetical protein ACRDWY_18710, partial [Actinomycetes bacterium]
AGEDEPPSGWTSWPRWGRTAALLAVLTFYVNSASISTHAAALDRRDSVAKRWVTTAREELREKPYTTVFDAPVPGQVVASVFLDASWASRVLGTLPEGEDRFNRTTDRLGVFDADGRLRGVEIVAATRSGVGPIPGCGWALSGETVGIPLPRRLRASDWVVRIGYYTATGAAARVDVGRDRFSVQVPPGLGYLYVFPRHAVDDVSVTGVDVDTPVCVANVTVGRAWPRER